MRISRLQGQLLSLVLLLAAVWGFAQAWALLWGLLWPFLAGLLGALLLERPVQWLQSRGMPRAAAGAVCLAAGLSLTAALTVWAGAVAWGEIARLGRHLPQILTALASTLDRAGRGAGRAQAALPPSLRSLVAAEALRASAALQPVLRQLGLALQRAVTGVPETLFACFVAFATAYFSCRDRAQLVAALGRRMPPRAAPYVRVLAETLRRTVWGMVRAQLLLSVATFGVSLAGLLAIGAPYVLLASAAAALFDFLPILGPALLYGPWAAGLALAHLPGAALGICGVLAAVGVVRWCLTPHLLGSQVGLHPFVALAAMYVGAKLAGLWGLLLGPTAAVLAQALLALPPAPPAQPPRPLPVAPAPTGRRPP